MEEKSYLTMEEASDYLSVDSMQMNLLISEGILHTVLYAKNWVGVAIPSPKTVKAKLDIHIFNIFADGKKQYLLKYTPKTRNRIISKKVTECETSQYWYLNSESASLLINSILPSKSEIVFLKPLDESTLKRNNPEQFPFDDFIVELSKTYTELGIQQQDLLILKTDLMIVKKELETNKDTKPRLKQPKIRDEIFFIIEIYFNKYLAKNSNNIPSDSELWSFMIQDESSKHFTYKPGARELKFITVAGKKDTLKLRAFKWRFNQYIS